MFSNLTAQAPVQLGSNYPGRAIEVKSHLSLIDTQVQHMIDAIKASLGLSDAEFNAFFLPLIYRYMDYTQLLPSLPQSHLGTLLLEGLARTQYCMQHWVEGRRGQDVLELYAGFSAALLMDIDKIFQLYQVNLLDKKGELIGHWNPYHGSMVGMADYYVIVPSYRDALVFKSPIVNVLAKTMIGESIYQTLSDDRVLYYEWLALLTQVEGVQGVFAQLLGLFKDPELLEKIKACLDDVDLEVSFLEDYDLEHGYAFLNWLREQLNEGKLDVNQLESGVHLIEQGVFIEPKVLMNFLRASAVGCGFLQAYYQFMGLMGISRSELNGEQFAQVFSDNPAEIAKITKGQAKGSWLGGAQSGGKQSKEGIIVKNPDLIFKNMPGLSDHVHALKTASALSVGQQATASKDAAPVSK